MKKKISVAGLLAWWKQLAPHKKIIFVWLFLLSVLLLFFPLIRVSLTDGASYLWLFHTKFFGLACLSLLLLVVLWWWNFHHGVRQLIHVVLGFKDNDHLLNFGMFLTLTATYLWIGTGASVSSMITSSISLTWSYTVILVILFVMMAYSLYLILHEARLLNKSWFMNIIRRRTSKNKDTDTVQSLFDDVEVSN